MYVIEKSSGANNGTYSCKSIYTMNKEEFPGKLLSTQVFVEGMSCCLALFWTSFLDTEYLNSGGAINFQNFLCSFLYQILFKLISYRWGWLLLIISEWLDTCRDLCFTGCGRW